MLPAKPKKGEAWVAARFDVDACLEQLQQILVNIRACEEPGELVDAMKKADLIAKALEQVDGADRAIREAQRAKLEAMAQLGALAGDPVDNKTRATLGGKGEKLVRGPDKFEGLDRRRIQECREVAGAREFIDAYVRHCEEQGLEVTRPGLRRFTEDRLRQLRASTDEKDEDDQVEADSAEEVEAEDETRLPPPGPAEIATSAARLQELLEEAEDLVRCEIDRLASGQSDLWARFLKAAHPRVERLMRDAYDFRKHADEVVAGGKAVGVGAPGRARTPDEKANDPFDKLRGAG